MASDALIEIHDVSTGCLKVTSLVVGARDEHIGAICSGERLVHILEEPKFFQNSAHIFEWYRNLLFGLGGFHHCADDSNVFTLRSHLMGSSQHSQMHVMLAVQLVAWEDHLAGVQFVGILHRMVDEGDVAKDLSNFLHLVREVRRISNDHFGLGNLSLRLDTHKLALVVIHNFLNRCVQHVSTTTDSSQTSERLRELTETVERIDERGLAKLAQRVPVELHLLNGVHRRLAQVLICGVQSNCMSQELLSALLQTKVLVNFSHRCRALLVKNVWKVLKG
mmetsp:Transcript_11486/g.28933  ORF Transcript_11486/g.28933 Transcript_11486/m.28933 type:complete len:278 (+) Transcript_11486:164-997(+)